MKRISLTNSHGEWFDKEKAEVYKENTYHNGSNFISKATSSQFEHEAVYVTKGGKFILNHWSNWQGTTETYEEISKERAARWFAKQDFQDNEIPDVFIEEVNKYEII